MTRNTKIVLGVVAGVLVLCVCVSVAGIAMLAATGRQVYRNMPEQAVRVQQVLSDPVLVERAPMKYDMPSGWREDFSLHILGFEMIGLGGNDDHSHIFLLQLPPDRNAENSVRDALAGVNSSHTTYRNGMEFHKVGQTDVTLRGQRVTMTISEGTNRDGDTYRQLAGVALDGTGQTVVVIEQPVKSWDQAMVDKFIASIQ